MDKNKLMNRRRFIVVTNSAPLTAGLSLCLALSACAQAVMYRPPSLSPRQKSELIERLEEAKRTDWNDALDPNIAPATEEDFLSQMNKADRAIRELRHGFEVPEKELKDALWVPPKFISQLQRSQLIAQLETARRQDDHNEQEMLNDLAWSDSGLPAQTTQFDEQKQLVDNVVKDLEVGESVHWSTIKEALTVPPTPY